MRALLLAAGFGSRLGDLTKETPKPLLNVGDKPILAFCLDQLWKVGITEVVVNTHYLADKIQKFVDSYDTQLRILLSHEEHLLGTAGTLKKHINYLAEEDFVVMHADNYFADSFSSFVTDHKSRRVGKFGSLGTFESPNPQNCGVLVLNPDKTVLEFHEKIANPPTNIANAAIYIFTPEVRDPVLKSTQLENDISRHLIPKIMSGLFTHNFEGLFVDIGTPEGLKLANDYEEELRRSETR
jgi:mannose-1-phosphate guanylyltransferase